VQNAWLFFIARKWAESEEFKMAKIKETLLRNLKSAVRDCEFYSRMARETNQQALIVDSKIKGLECTISKLKETIRLHSDEPLYRRGLADDCFKYERLSIELTELYLKISGIYSVASYARENQLKAEERKNDLVRVLYYRYNVDEEILESVLEGGDRL
jgi:hypothetical protein